MPCTCGKPEYKINVQLQCRLVMDLCDGSLAELLPQVRQQCDTPGLPPVDTVALGLMLCSALDAVHHSARCLHLDITPANVLLTAPRRVRRAATPPGAAGGEARSVRRSNFGLSKHLPSCVLSSLTSTSSQSRLYGAAKGRPGYAPMEHLQGKAQRRSDVYSLGATLLYAATGVHPGGGKSLASVYYQIMSGAGASACLRPSSCPCRVRSCGVLRVASVLRLTTVSAHSVPVLCNLIRTATNDPSIAQQGLAGGCHPYVTHMHAIV